jgi:2-polyprenyl-3-methyl-5-hydroxy-6-metoxy-1,4-benzoquinol methylase
MRKKVGIINRYSTKKGSLLDYGCGTGHFLKAAKKDQWKVTGIEPNEKARTTSKEFGIKAYASIDELKKNKKFDVITLFHVLEHINPLRATIKSLLNHLNDEGKLMIAVPNHLSYDAQHYQAHWAAWDVPRHLYHFNQSSIESFAAEFKMEIESILPMTFDSYYVSILSEKYKRPNRNGVQNLVNGLNIGYQSNSWASKNNNEYSSLLFILKKK